MNAEQRLKELGIELPIVQPGIGTYLAAKTWGDTVFVSGHGPVRVDVNGCLPGKTTKDIELAEALPHIIVGKVGADIDLDAAREAARMTTLFMLSALRDQIGSLDRVASIVKVFGMVNCAPGFTNTPAVIDGCSDFLVDVFGREVGNHARTAVGLAELPMNIAVEIEMVVGVTD
jgi:enamine deaminase RidA (YjgF/YER057c/UK114 family)